MSEILCIFKEWILVFFKEGLPFIKNLVFIGAAFVGGYVGIQGLGAWREQLKGKTEYELAKQLLRSVYELREAIASVRDPFMSYPQEPDLPKEKLQELTPQEKAHYALGQAYEKRWEPISKANVILSSTLLEAEVVWGQQIVTTVTPLREWIRDLSFAIKDHVESKNPNNGDERLADDKRKDRGLIMYDIFNSDKNKYTKQLEEAIAAIEKELKPHIGQYHKGKGIQPK